MAQLFSRLGSRYKKALIPSALLLCAGLGSGVVHFLGSWDEPKVFGSGEHLCVGKDILALQKVGMGPTIDEAAKEVRRHCFYECTIVLCENGVQK